MSSENMLQIGKNITAAHDQMQKIEPLQLFDKIAHPSSELTSKIEQLRTLHTIDPKKYQQCKTGLPYFTCGIFNPPLRKLENFGSIEYFMIDIDHLSALEVSVENLKTVLKQDSRVVMMFVSPGADGLKIMFHLHEKCFEAVQYKAFYKLFAHQFSMQYQLLQVIDLRTCDVTRACFLSADQDAFFNPDHENVRIKEFVNFDNEFEFEAACETIREIEKNAPRHPTEHKEEKPLSEDLFDEIKQKLNPSVKTNKEKIIYVPEELEKTIEIVKQRMNETGITFKTVTNIHYGKKFVFEAVLKWCEINLFYGKKGFSVVITPKAGSNSELAEICRKIMCELFF
jgi:predicted small metal-binding protein